MISRAYLAIACAVLLCGCAGQSIEEVRAGALKQAEDHCRSEGKQFLLQKTEQKESFWGGGQVMVAGYCAGPGDPGYVAPNKANTTGPQT
ncbi:MAG: hypothetical protein KGJ78_14500 [Alphaproteobacteria bacterium]|nr:hypothetical protein [Alphaproteobacteria bacterium]